MTEDHAIVFSLEKLPSSFESNSTIFQKLHIMTLVPAIEFRDLVAQLTEDETQVFISKLALADPQLIISSLSSRFIWQSKNERDDHQNTECNEMISTIIQSRDEECSKASNGGLDTLPRRLIGICGSYLDQTGHAALSVCDRATFLGCNSPIMLTELSVWYQCSSELELPDLSIFPFCNKLTFRVDSDEDSQFVLNDCTMKSIASQIAKLPRLRSLDLSAADWRLTKIIAKQEPIGKRTKSLSLEVLDATEYVQFIAAITCFKDLQFLKVSLTGDELPTANSRNKSLIEMCGNLKGLDFYDADSGIQVPILQAIGHKLHFLMLHDAEEDDEAPRALRKIDFANLRELRQGMSSDKMMRAILKTAINLEKVTLNCSADLIVEIFSKCEKLKYLEFIGVQCLDNILDNLERGLFKTKKLKRNTLKIRMNAIISNHDECIMKLNRTINSLSINPVDQWMLMLQLRTMKKNKRTKSFVKDLKECLTAETAVVEDISNNMPMILITNPGCTICGSNESWLMNF